MNLKRAHKGSSCYISSLTYIALSFFFFLVMMNPTMCWGCSYYLSALPTMCWGCSYYLSALIKSCVEP